MTKSNQHIQTGKIGESEGVAHLKRVGYQILETNYRTYAGEIDCIATHKDTLVFIEIKTRRSDLYGSPGEAVIKTKQRRIIKGAQVYLQEKSYNLPQMNSIRFDVLGILMTDSGQFKFDLIQDAFQMA